MKNHIKRRDDGKVLIGVGVLLVVVFVVVFFRMPYSRTKQEFRVLSQRLMQESPAAEGVFSEQDIGNLPEPVQRYFTSCGYLGTPKMSYMKAYFENAVFSLGKDKRDLRIDYTQYNFVDKPVHLALMDSSMFGVPFEGLDTYVDGVGAMKGVIAKLFTLFDRRGESMDKACLVTYLAECLIVPNAALQDYIVWEPVDNLHAKATISSYGISASGVFTFNERGEMVAFDTNDRVAVAMDGTVEDAGWTAVCSEYEERGGIRVPTRLQAIWHFDAGDLVYFDGNVEVEYGVGGSAPWL